MSNGTNVPPITDFAQSTLFIKSLTRKQAATLASTLFLKPDFTERQLIERFCEACNMVRYVATIGLWKDKSY